MPVSGILKVCVKYLNCQLLPVMWSLNMSIQLELDGSSNTGTVPVFKLQNDRKTYRYRYRYSVPVRVIQSSVFFIRIWISFSFQFSILLSLLVNSSGSSFGSDTKNSQFHDACTISSRMHNNNLEDSVMRFFSPLDMPIWDPDSRVKAFSNLVSILRRYHKYRCS
jgi:hypothetical protein